MTESLSTPETPPPPTTAEKPLSRAERRQKRIELAWQKIESGEDQVGKLFVDVVASHIENPPDRFAGKVVFKELQAAKASLAEAEDIEIKRKALRAIYGRRPGGLKKLNSMSNEQVEEEAVKFAQVAARELYLARYLDRSGAEIQTQQELAKLCGAEKISRRQITFKAIEASRRKTTTSREIGRLMNRLDLTDEQRANIAEAVNSRYRPEEVDLSKKNIQEKTEEAIQTIRSEQSDFVDQMNPSVIRQAAWAKAELSLKREKLIASAKSADVAVISAEINSVRAAEKVNSVCHRGLKAEILAARRRQEVDKIFRETSSLQETKWNMFKELIRDFADSTFTIATSLPKEAWEKVQAKRVAFTHNLAEMFHRPLTIFNRVGARIANESIGRISGAKEHLVGFLQDRSKDFQAVIQTTLELRDQRAKEGEPSLKKALISIIPSADQAARFYERKPMPVAGMTANSVETLREYGIIVPEDLSTNDQIADLLSQIAEKLAASEDKASTEAEQPEQIAEEQPTQPVESAAAQDESAASPAQTSEAPLAEESDPLGVKGYKEITGLIGAIPPDATVDSLMKELASQHGWQDNKPTREYLKKAIAEAKRRSAKTEGNT